MNKENVRRLCRQYQDGEIRVDQFTDALEKEGMDCAIAHVIHDLHREIRFLTNVGKLDEEDQAVARKWREERIARRKLIDKLGDVPKHDKEGYAKVLEEIASSSAKSYCEHERSIWKPCAACDHIERTLYPEMFPDDEDDE